MTKIKRHLNIVMYLLTTFLVLVGCEHKKTDLETRLIETILEADTLYNDYILLDFYQGRFNQDLRSDTLFLLLNGRIFGEIHHADDSSLFKNANNDSISFYNSQGKLELQKFKVYKLDSNILTKVDTVPTIKDADLKNYYDIDWLNFPSNYKGYKVFSKPIVNSRGLGFISLSVCNEGGMNVYLYSFWLNTLPDFKLESCFSYRPIVYQIDFENDKIKNLRPVGIIIQGSCD